MIALIQRVSEASITINEKTIGQIKKGLVLLLGIEKNDTKALADKLLDKTLNYRVFSDENNKMNSSLLSVSGDLLIISQFTLVANTSKGLRPGFETSAKPNLAEPLYDYFLQQAKLEKIKVQSGFFGADMQVSLINDGPVTFWLKV